MIKLTCNLMILIGNADAFLEIAEEQERKANNIQVDGRNTLYSGPRNLSLIFSCELYLKAIIQIQKGEFPGTYDLLKLFSLIKKVTKDKLKEEFINLTQTDINELLEIERNAFVEWRYISVGYNANWFYEDKTFKLAHL